MKFCKILFILGLCVTSSFSLGNGPQNPHVEQDITDDYIMCFTKEQWWDMPKVIGDLSGVPGRNTYNFHAGHWLRLFETRKIHKQKLQDITEDDTICFTKEQWKELPFFLSDFINIHLQKYRIPLDRWRSFWIFR